MTSPGRCAPPPGIFSAQAAYAVTETFNSKSAIARIVETTAAAPDMSSFIWCIFAGGFSEMPPVSNVMPLPTNATCLVAPFGRYSIRIKRGGRVEPWPTPRIPP